MTKRTRNWRLIGRRDLAEPTVVAAFEAGGASVERLPGGKGRPDLLVGFMGVTHEVEVKTNDAVLSDGQTAWAAAWKGEALVVARTPAQARKWLRIWEIAHARQASLSSLLRAQRDAAERERVKAAAWSGPHAEDPEAI